MGPMALTRSKGTIDILRNMDMEGYVQTLKDVKPTFHAVTRTYEISGEEGSEALLDRPSADDSGYSPATPPRNCA